jgi:hypothetical protein
MQFQGDAPINLGCSHTESLVSTSPHGDNFVALIADCAVYHFHDTSDTANVKRLQAINDNVKLRQDARMLFCISVPQAELKLFTFNPRKGCSKGGTFPIGFTKLFTFKWLKFQASN